jgi:hypothetical protein
VVHHRVTIINSQARKEVCLANELANQIILFQAENVQKVPLYRLKQLVISIP